MSSVLDISSMYNSYSSKLSSTSADSLESALKSTNSSSDDEKLMEGNVMTEYEERFSSQGNPICKLVAIR